MRENLMFINGLQKSADPNPLWKWKGIDFQTSRKPEGKLYPVTEFFNDNGRKVVDDVVLGPGVGAGIGCGVGLGLGVVGGAGIGGPSWNQLSAVFGVGIGCGVGVGVGYGQGFGVGSTLESLRAHLFGPKPKSKKRVRV